MKPELKAMIDTLEASMDFFTPGPRRAPQILKAAFLSSLHWRGDELWAGPIMFGGVTGWKRSYRWFTCVRGQFSPPMGLDAARATLEAAAKSQIETWF